MYIINEIIIIFSFHSILQCRQFCFIHKYICHLIMEPSGVRPVMSESPVNFELDHIQSKLEQDRVMKKKRSKCLIVASIFPHHLIVPILPPIHSAVAINHEPINTIIFIIQRTLIKQHTFSELSLK